MFVIAVIISIWKKILDQNQFLARKMVPRLCRPANSPDLSPPDLIFFSKVEDVAQEAQFCHHETIQVYVTQEFKKISGAEFSRAMDVLGDRARSFIECNGDYIE